MAFILALETSSTICSVALYKDDQLLGLSELQIEKSHSSHITILIEQLLQNCRVKYSDISAIALSGGPGSYTGLRIGSSTAKGLCFALNIPLIEVSTLKALAAEAIVHTPQAEKYWFCPMIDARRLEVYACVLDENLKEIKPVAPVVLEPNSFDEYLKERPIVFAGKGAAKYKSLVDDSNKILYLDYINPSARVIGKLAWQRFTEEKFEDVAYYEPFYLKEVYITSKKS